MNGRPTGILGILQTQEIPLPWPCPASPIFVKVEPALSYRNAHGVIVEIPTIQLEKLDQKRAQVLLWIQLAPPQLWMDLQKTDNEADHSIRPQTPGEDLVHRSLGEKGFDDDDELPRTGQSGEKAVDDSSRGDPVGLVERNIDVDLALVGDEFDDGYSGFTDNSDRVGDSPGFHRSRQFGK